MRSTILKASFLIIVAILSSVVAKHVYSRQLSTAALTATTTESYFRYPTGEYVRSEQRTLFVRGDGSSVELKRGVAPDGRPVEKRILVDITARKRVVIDGMTDSITTYPLRESQALKAAQRMQRCASGLNPERRVLLGYDVELVHAEYSVPGVEFRVVDAWEAPTLNCLALKQLIKSGSSRDTLVTTNIIWVWLL